jgi:hypothetical protein
MKKRWEGRLPNGTITTDEDTYVDTWKRLVAKVEEKFPGYKMFGFDPGISLACVEARNQHSLCLSIHAIKALLGSEFE